MNDAETLALIVWCKQQAPLPLPPDAIGVEVSHPDNDGDPPLFARPGPEANDIMFRLTGLSESERALHAPGFKLYGTGFWPATHAGGEDCGSGRAEAFAVSARTAADVLNRLLVRGWTLATCPPELAGMDARAWNPQTADDIRPLSARLVEAVCLRKGRAA